MLAPDPIAGLRVALWTTRPDADFDLRDRLGMPCPTGRSA